MRWPTWTQVGAASAAVFALVATVMGGLAWHEHASKKRAALRARQHARQASLAQAETAPRLLSISPPQVSNRTGYPVMLRGERLGAGMQLVVAGQRIPTRRLDERHRGARPPAGLGAEQPKRPAVQLQVSLVDAAGVVVAGKAPLSIVNDAGYPVPRALSLTADGAQLVVAARETDTLWLLPADTAGDAQAVTVGDGPVAVRSYAAPDGTSMLAILHADGGELWLAPAASPAQPRTTIAVGGGAAGLAVGVAEGQPRFLVTLPADDAVAAYDSQGKQLWRAAAGRRPMVAVRAGDAWVIGDHGLGSFTVLDDAGQLRASVTPGPGVAIVGGHTAEFSEYVMSGTPVRDVVASARHGVVFASSVGPSVGPNPERKEVTMNGGVAVLDPGQGRYLRHVALPRGIPQGLWLDDARDVLYAADVATGTVWALDVRVLLRGQPAAEDAVLASLELTPPDDTPVLRRRQAFGRDFPGPFSLHTGPWTLVGDANGTGLHVLERFSGRVTRLDVRDVRRGRLALVESRAVVDRSPQRRRRVGEIAYFTDLGGTRMSCDGCHVDGHSGGLLFTKREPMHIYRVPTLRSVRLSPPYFTPAFLPTLQFVSRFVLDRNRDNRPEASKHEVDALSLYQATLVTDPNPLRGEDGALPRQVELPSGGRGNPYVGLALFEGPGKCVDCHPPPTFTTDQALETRRRAHDIGTPVTLGLRTEMQDAAPYPLPPPSLLGVRDVFPLLHSGAGGVAVRDGRLSATEGGALQAVLAHGARGAPGQSHGPAGAAGEPGGQQAHGGMPGLSAQQLADLQAFLLTL